jgi:hypothetical protein
MKEERGRKDGGKMTVGLMEGEREEVLKLRVN